MIKELLELIFWFFVAWFGGFIIHELCHKFECERQGGKGYISIWFHHGIPSMRCGCSYATNDALVRLAGGLYAGILLMIISLISFFIYTPIHIATFICGLVNLTYSFYEMKYLPELDMDKYMFWHYILYLITIIIGLLLMSENIINYIN